jgi:xanthine dehydrogenase accessory factor
MYDIALSVAACARSGTRADVAWMIRPTASDEALAFTPGGGRIGSVQGGAFDGLLADAAARQLSTGRRLRHVVTELESLVCGLEQGTDVEFLVVPAAQFPPQLWPLLLEREPVAIAASVVDDEVTEVELTQPESTGADRPVVTLDDGRVTTLLVPITRLVVAGQGPIAQALADQAGLLGWKAVVEPRPGAVAGLAAGLSPLDGIVVLGHDVEAAGTCLMAALESTAGYIAAVGSPSMQESRAQWLALRDVTDLSRVHGPAGLEIGARGPGEIAVSIAAEMIGALRLG